MKSNTKRPAAKTARSAEGADGAKAYLEFALAPATMAQVTALARQSHCTPFALCVGLLEESLGQREHRA